MAKNHIWDNYSGTTITNDKHCQTWNNLILLVPSIAPSGFDYLNSDIYADWKVASSWFIKYMYLERLVLENNKVTYREKVAENVGRVRDVKVSPDGYIYLAVDTRVFSS